MDANERRNRASSEAADWWALLQGDDMTKAEREHFIDWLRDSQTNIAEMLRLSQVHGSLHHFRHWAEISTDMPGNQAEIIALPPQRKPAPSPRGGGGSRTRRRTMRLLGFTATFAVVACLVAFLLTQWRGQIIATERGERRAVTLDDGSEVQVDPQTRLTVKFGKDRRHVWLTQGRALFRVAKNASRPFLVTAGDITVRAVGTSFGVEQRPGDVVVVTVSEGKVAVSSAGLRPPPPSNGDEIANGNGGEREILLGVNQQITVATAGTSQLVRTVNGERELAWAEGRLVFRNDPVAKVIAEFNRYNRLQIYVRDTELAARPVSGVFDSANPEAFIAFIQNAAPVQIERNEGRSIVISPGVSH